MKRREFLKGMAAATTGAAAFASADKADARGNLEPSPEGIGMLYDSTLCVGCKACVAKCKEVNGNPPVTSGPDEPWDMARDLGPKTFNVIKVYKDGDAARKDRAENGFCFEKRSCMHCIDPGCVSACPTTSMRHDRKLGIIYHNPDTCIGCRNCMVACPYNVPQFDYDNVFGNISKCQFCNQPGVERINKGLLPGCVEACPTGATLFGPRKELLKEAKRRLRLKEGEIYNYPRGDVTKPDSYHEKPAPKYNDHIWGEKEAGGTSVLHIAAVPFDKLGMPPLGERSAASVAETVQHTLYSYLALPLLALAGLSYVVKRNMDKDNGEG